MKTLLKMMAFISIFVSIISCSNLDPLESMSTTENKVHYNVLKFKYQGVEYTAKYELKDSVMIFADPIINDMLSELNNNPNSATLTYPDGMIEYFNSSKELDEFLNKENTITRGVAQNNFNLYVITSLTLKVYEHADFKGKVLTYNGYKEIPNMKNAYNLGVPYLPTNFNDIISSFQLTVTRRITMGTPVNEYPSAILIFYKDANYKSSSRAFILDMNHQQISLANFKSIKFNDQISSFKLYGVRNTHPTAP